MIQPYSDFFGVEQSIIVSQFSLLARNRNAPYISEGLKEILKLINNEK